jgi:hypothetical protein
MRASSSGLGMNGWSKNVWSKGRPYRATSSADFHSNEQGSTFECQLSKDYVVVRPWENCTSPKSYSNLSRHELWDTTYEFEVKATDPAGNVEPTPAGRYWFIERGTDPQPPPPPPDTKAPKVNSVLPKEDATGVSPAVNVKATFSEEMSDSSINGQTFKLFKKGSTTRIAAQITYPDPNSPPYTAKLDPKDSMTRGATYKAVVSTGAKDQAGNSLDQDASLSGSQQMAWFFKVSN